MRPTTRRARRSTRRCPPALTGLLLALATVAAADEPTADLSGYDPACGIDAARDGDRLRIAWPFGSGRRGRLVLDLRPDRPSIAELGWSDPAGVEHAVLRGVEPATFVTVGTRVAPPGRPPAMSPFNTFFDSPASRPHETYLARLGGREARVESRGRRLTVRLAGLEAGPFAGELRLTFYAGARLVHVEAALTTTREDTAFTYDAGLVSREPGWRGLAWYDTEGALRREPFDPDAADRPIAVRHRALAVTSDGGSVACFPPPHQFFYPRDLTDNQQTCWAGRGHRGLEGRAGFGVRQTEAGGGAFVPWFNAPPGTEQRLGVFYLIAEGDAESALREALRYTHGDRFPDLPGHVTLSSHWHMAIAVEALRRREAGGPPASPDFVRMFKDMNVNILHLAEFHGDGHPQDPGPLRLPELDAMFSECRRLSDDELLLLPGEEANVHLGLREPGKHPGHWVYLFPGPVRWIMRRDEGEPFVEEHPEYGRLYRVGDRREMQRLLELEGGLAWTAHPRIKASSWTPDIYRHEDFYLADTWLGAAWKAMPADLSRPRLGERVLDLLDDMANWGPRKYVLGEVDVFKLDHTHELYGHMNVNYVRLDRLPSFDEGWRPVLDALRAGRFFVTTGEVLIRDFRVGDRESGETLSLSDDDRPEVRLELSWTFPASFVEIVSGDGRSVYRQRLDLSDAGPFESRTIALRPDLAGRTWVRAEAWDVAADGAFTQPVWLAPAPADR